MPAWHFVSSHYDRMRQDLSWQTLVASFSPPGIVYSELARPSGPCIWLIQISNRLCPAPGLRPIRVWPDGIGAPATPFCNAVAFQLGCAAMPLRQTFTSHVNHPRATPVPSGSFEPLQEELPWLHDSASPAAFLAALGRWLADRTRHSIRRPATERRIVSQAKHLGPRYSLSRSLLTGAQYAHAVQMGPIRIVRLLVTQSDGYPLCLPRRYPSITHRHKETR
jgi:hypothetical protein